MILKNIDIDIIIIFLVLFLSYHSDAQTNNTEFAHIIEFNTVNGTIYGDNEATINIYMQNPSNETMMVELNIVPSSNIDIYSSRFNQFRNNYFGSFIIYPGQNSSVAVKVKSDKIGTHYLIFNGQYWFNLSQTRYNIKTYKQVIYVKTSLDKENKENQSNLTIQDNKSKKIPNISEVYIYLVISIGYLIRKLGLRN